ncbi:Tn3 family transposase [Wenjunlia vitaminophila]|uniref:Tn3 family transposase n=1 Tax=Wenjunlia vitaminophila TaxID=76728 RepID=UPI00039AFA3C|nr:Tn3 family transposase [Wenjunlia vitaminophila]
MIGAQLNVTEARHRLDRKIFFGQRGEPHQHYREGMEDQLGALGMALNAVVLFNSPYIDTAVKQLAADGFPITDELIARLSPLQYGHINFLSRYAFTRPPAPGPRQLRDPHSDDEMDDDERGWPRARAAESGPARSHRL